MGNYLVFEINKMLVKQEMQAFLNSFPGNQHALVLKIFKPESNPDFRRVEAKEIIYKGRLYDILKESKQGHMVVFFCIQDKKEELLIAGFKKVQHHKTTLSLLHNLITQALPVDLSQYAELQGIDFNFPEKDQGLSLVYPGHFSPPPETA